MAKTCINFKPTKGNSELHNTREQKPNYLRDTGLANELWIGKTIADAQAEIEKTCKEVGGRKLQKNCTPIKEAVVLIGEEHTIIDLQTLGKVLQNKYHINLIQVHIHRDEGKQNEDGTVKINRHAHMIFDWQNKVSGKINRLTKLDMANIQTITAEILGMERGKVHSKAERLEHGEYREEMKRLDSELKMFSLQVEVKKNESLNLDEELNSLEHEVAELEKLYTAKKQLESKIIAVLETAWEMHERLRKSRNSNGINRYADMPDWIYFSMNRKEQLAEAGEKFYMELEWLNFNNWKKGQYDLFPDSDEDLKHKYGPRI